MHSQEIYKSIKKKSKINFIHAESNVLGKSTTSMNIYVWRRNVLMQDS